MNALAMFVLSGLVAKTLGLVKVPWADQFISLQAAIYRSVFVPIGPDKVASLAYAIANVLFFWAIAWLMYRRKWFVKL
jgi:predicted acyltransferase